MVNMYSEYLRTFDLAGAGWRRELGIGVIGFGVLFFAFSAAEAAVALGVGFAVAVIVV